jgi:hypothetical protein
MIEVFLKDRRERLLCVRARACRSLKLSISIQLLFFATFCQNSLSSRCPSLRLQREPMGKRRRP